MISPISATTTLVAQARAEGRSPLAALAPELRAQVYGYLRADDCTSVARTNKQHFHTDAELWARLVHPLCRVPLNAVSAWNTRKAQEARIERHKALTEDYEEAMSDAGMACFVGSAVCLVLGMVAGSAALIATLDAQPDGEEPAPPTPLLVGMGMGLAIGLTLTAANYVYERTFRKRLLRALSRPLEMPPLEPSTLATRTRSPQALRTWRNELAPLRAQVQQRFLRIRPDTLPGSDLAFLIDDLHLPIPLSGALRSDRPSLLARSIKTLTYLDQWELDDVLHNIRDSFSRGLTPLVRIALNSASKDDFRALFWNPSHFRPWVTQHCHAPALDLLLQRFTDRERPLFINDVSSGNGDSLFHTAADAANADGFRVLFAHGGNLETADTFAHCTVRQSALRQPWMRYGVADILSQP